MTDDDARAKDFAAPVQVLMRLPDAGFSERGWHLLRNFNYPVTLRVSRQAIEVEYAKGLGKYLTPDLSLNPRRSSMKIAKVAGVYGWRRHAPLRIVIEGPSPRGPRQLAVLSPRPNRSAQMLAIWHALVAAGVSSDCDPAAAWGESPAR